MIFFRIQMVKMAGLSIFFIKILSSISRPDFGHVHSCVHSKMGSNQILVGWGVE